MRWSSLSVPGDTFLQLRNGCTQGVDLRLLAAVCAATACSCHSWNPYHEPHYIGMHASRPPA